MAAIQEGLPSAARGLFHSSRHRQPLSTAAKLATAAQINQNDYESEQMRLVAWLNDPTNVSWKKVPISIGARLEMIQRLPLSRPWSDEERPLHLPEGRSVLLRTAAVLERAAAPLRHPRHFLGRMMGLGVPKP